MAIQLFIGVVTEGTTDIRFLTTILENVFLDIAVDCLNEVSIDGIIFFDAEGDGFVEKMLNASTKGVQEYGISILCVHTDQDRDTEIYNHKITPLQNALSTKNTDSYCKVIVPIIPIRMIEAWMLADKELLKERIYGCSFRDVDLGLHREPETYADPKNAIENAIRIAQENRPKKRRDEITISELYSEIGNSIKLEKLRALPSFLDFEKNVRNAFIQLHYLVE